LALVVYAVTECRSPESSSPGRLSMTVAGRRNRAACPKNFDELFAKRNREAVPERELKPKVAKGESVREIIAARPLEFAAHHHILHRSGKEISNRVLASLEGAGNLAVAVGDVDP